MKQKQKSTGAVKKALRDNSLTRPEYIRVQAIYLKKQHYPLKEIETITGKDIRTIQTWITSFNKNGVGGLKTKKREKPTNFVLTKAQKDEIKKIATEHKPKDKGLSGDFWSVPTIRQLVKKKYQVEYKTEKSYQNLLHYCGFTYQKAEYIDKRKNEELSGHFKTRFKRRLKKGTFSMSW